MENRLSKAPNDPEALFNLASLDLAAGHSSTASGLFRRALASSPRDVRIATALGSALYKAGDLDGARAQLEAAVALDGSYVDARLDLALVAMQRNDPGVAERQFRALVALNPKDAISLTGLGSALLALDRVTEAQVSFEGALRVDGMNFDALYNLATIEAAAGQSEAALRHLLVARAVRPEDVDVRRGLVSLYAPAGRLADALGEQREIVRLQPDLAAEWDNLGVLEVRSGDRVAARRSFQRALRLDPASASAFGHLAHL